MRRRGFGLIAAAALAAAATLAVPATSAGATATHVGIVVRFPDGSSQSACTTIGGSGLAVLERKFTVVIGQAPPYAGFVFTINDQGTRHPDDTHYWSYWHSSGNGSWIYSSSGAGSYTPKAETVEGWSYVNGSNTASTPPAMTYSSLCGSSDPQPKPSATATHKPAPKHQPTPKHRPTPQPTPKPVHHATTSANVTSTSAAVSTARSSTAGRASSSSAAVARHASASAIPGRTDGVIVASSGTPSAGPAAGTIRAAPSHKSAAGLPAWGTALAIAVVLAIGGAAWLRTRRRPE